MEKGFKSRQVGTRVKLSFPAQHSPATFHPPLPSTTHPPPIHHSPASHLPLPRLPSTIHPPPIHHSPAPIHHSPAPIHHSPARIHHSPASHPLLPSIPPRPCLSSTTHLPASTTHSPPIHFCHPSLPAPASHPPFTRPHPLLTRVTRGHGSLHHDDLLGAPHLDDGHACVTQV